MDEILIKVDVWVYQGSVNMMNKVIWEKMTEYADNNGVFSENEAALKEVNYFSEVSVWKEKDYSESR